MANVYVYSGAVGTGTGADWANAYTTLGAACAAKAAGDIFFVAHDHAETQASANSIVSPGTEVTPCRIYCVNRAGSVPPVSADFRTTATVSTTGASNINFHGAVAECHGIRFTAGNGTSDASLNAASVASRTWKFVSCHLKLGGNHASGRIVPCGNLVNQQGWLENTTVEFSNANQSLQAGSYAVWRNTPSAVTGSPPSNLLTTAGGRWFVEGVDLSAAASGSTLCRTIDTYASTYILKDCKLGAGVTVCATPTSSVAAEVSLIRCDSGDTNYRTEKYHYRGTQTTETTVVRTGGASDATTPISWKIVTTANSKWELPFESLPISIWNDTTGASVTVTVQGIWGGGAVPNNDEIWIEVEYLGTSGFPLASKATSSKADGLASGVVIPAGTGTWGGSTTKFAMSATFVPQERGPLTIYVKAAKLSSTFYVDPKPAVV